MTIERITPDRVAAAYAKCGLKPRQHIHYDGECACGIVAVAAAETFGKVSALGLSDSYTKGFVKGFDVPFQRYFWDSPSKEFMEGFKDGRAAAIRMGLYVEPCS